MTKRAIFFLTLGLVLLVTGLGLLIKTFFLDNSSETGALQINSFPKADVYLDNVKMGQTPFLNEKMAAGDYTVKLMANNLVWAGKIKLTSETLTYVNRELGNDNNQTAGETLTLERLPGSDKGEITIISDPSGATVKLNGKDSGLTPLTLKNISPGDQELALSLASYRDRFLRGKVIASYRLNIAAQLAKNTETATNPEANSATPSAQLKPSATPTPGALSRKTTPSPTPTTTSNLPAKPYVTIKSTPTGWLRVRNKPNTSGEEVAKVNPKEAYPLLDEQSGWTQIKLNDGSVGWVNDSYIEKMK